MLFVDEWEAFVISMDKSITESKILSMREIMGILIGLKKERHISICSNSSKVLSEIEDRFNLDNGNLK